MTTSEVNRCAVCGVALHDGGDICAECASEVTAKTQMLICPTCKALSPMGSRACVQCNAAFKAPAKKRRAPIPSHGPPPPHVPVVRPGNGIPVRAPAPPQVENRKPVAQVAGGGVEAVAGGSAGLPRVSLPTADSSVRRLPVAAEPVAFGRDPVSLVRAESARLPSVPPPASLYARENDLQQLLRGGEGAIGNRQSHAVVVTGEPGMGVSTLLRTLCLRVRGLLPEERIRLLVCREPTEAFFPFSRILRDAFKTEENPDPNALRLNIANQVSDVLADESAQIIAETTHLMGFAAGVPFTGSPILRTLQKDQEALYSRLKAALLRFFRADLRRAPLMLVLDNAHKLEKGSREGRLLSDVLKELGDVPLWTVCGGHPSLAALLDADVAHQVVLEPLGEPVMRRLFEELLPRLENPPADMVAGTVKKAAGNPGALYELCSLLKESGVINTDGDVWTAEVSREKVSEILSDRRDALRVRLEQIDPRDKLVLQIASVFGDVFWDEAVVAMSRLEAKAMEKADAAQVWSDDADISAISSAIERLVERRFLVRLPEKDLKGTIKYAFYRSNIREKLLSTLGEEKKREYHGVAAEWLHHSASRHGVYLAELEADHWEAAGEQRRAALTCFRAAEFARARYLNPRAIELYNRGLALSGPADRLARIDALHDLGSIYELQGRLQEAESCLTEMLRNAWVLGHRNKAGAALNKIGRLYRLRGDGFAARAFLNRAMTLFRTSGDERGVAACLADLGELARQEGSFDRAYAQVREAFEIQRKLKNRRSMAVCLHSLGSIEAARAHYTKAERFLNEALEMRRKTNDRVGMAQTLSTLALMMFHRGDTEKAVQRYGAALEMAVEVGDRRMEAIINNNLGEVHQENRKFKESMAYFKAAEEIANALGDRLLLAEISRNMAMLSLKNGDVEQGRMHVGRALDLARHLNAKEMEGLAYRALGEIESTTMWDTSKTDGEDDAQVSFKRALEIFRGIGNQLEVAKTLYALGNRMLERGNVAGSRNILKEAKDIYKHIDLKMSERIDRTISETAEH